MRADIVDLLSVDTKEKSCPQKPRNTSPRGGTKPASRFGRLQAISYLTRRRQPFRKAKLPCWPELVAADLTDVSRVN